MGCDIHTMAEIFEDADYNDTPSWNALKEPVFPDPYYSADREIGRYNTPYTTTPYRGRNYVLFAFLADVRNGRGFAGVDTGDRITPIADPKGIPEDASREWHEYADDDVDLHSASYFTLTELLAADWDQVITHRGFVSEADYLKLRGTNDSPQMWSGGGWGEGVKYITAKEYEDGERGERRTEVQHQWTTTMREYAEGFLSITIPGLTAIAPREPDPENPSEYKPNFDHVRIVFAFDN